MLAQEKRTHALIDHKGTDEDPQSIHPPRPLPFPADQPDPEPCGNNHEVCDDGHGQPPQLGLNCFPTPTAELADDVLHCNVGQRSHAPK